MHGVRDVDWLVAAQQVRAVALLVHVDHSQAPSHRNIIFLKQMIKLEEIYSRHRVLTINVPLFKKLRDIIFFCGTITL